MLWTVARQPPLSLEFPRQEYGSVLPFPFPGDLLDPGIKPGSLGSSASAGEFFTTAPPGKPTDLWIKNQRLMEESWLQQSPSSWHAVAVPQILLFLLCFAHYLWWLSWEEHWPLSRSKASWGNHAINPLPSFLSSLSLIAHWLHPVRRRWGRPHNTDQPPGTEVRVYNGRENASGRAGDRLLVRMVPILHSLCISTLCNLILQLFPSKCCIYFFIPWI